MVREYIVTYAINVGAETPEEAAQQVAEIMKDPTSYGPCFEVEDILTGDITEIDTHKFV